MQRTTFHALSRLAALSLAIAAPFTANAGEVYGSVGFPGVTLGYASKQSDQVDVRVDFTTAGSIRTHQTVSGVDYDIHARADRIALLADWFPAGSFRLTAGLTANKARLDAQSRPLTGSVTIGDTTYTAGPNDGFAVHGRFPTVMPYVGLGFGHAGQQEKGWGFIMDVGLSIGRADVTGTAQGNLATLVSQQDVQTETERVRHDVNRFGGIPQLSVGASYKF